MPPWSGMLDRLRERVVSSIASSSSRSSSQRTFSHDDERAPDHPRNAPPAAKPPPAPKRTLFDRPLVSFDIETIPDPDIGRRVLGFTGTDSEVVHEMVKKRLEETENKREYPHLPHQRVACVCVTVLDPQTGKVDIRALSGVNEPDWRNERGHVEGFFRFVSEEVKEPRLVSWNGNGFDIAVLRYRAMMLGIAAPAFYRADEGGGGGRMQGYRDQHIDMMDVLCDRGASSRAGLAAVSSSVGLPGKTFLERPIYDHVLEGESERVAEYCKMDTAETLLLFLLWSFHTGRLSREDLRRYVASVREAVSKLPYPGWRDVEQLLGAWPTWIGSGENTATAASEGGRQS